MEREELRPIEPRRPDAGYETQGQLLEDLSAWVDLLLYQYYCRHQWLGPDSELKNMLGLVVSREEFEHNLARAAQRGLYIQLDAGEQAELDALYARYGFMENSLPDRAVEEAFTLTFPGS